MVKCNECMKDVDVQWKKEVIVNIETDDEDNIENIYCKAPTHCPHCKAAGIWYYRKAPD